MEISRLRLPWICLWLGVHLNLACTHNNGDQWPENNSGVTHETKEPGKTFNRTVSRLLDKANEQRDQKEFLKAQMTLERAHRIAPHDVSVAIALARVHTDQRRWRTAISWAERTLETIDKDHQLYSEAWMVIYRCKSELGDLAGAAEAIQNASD